MLLAALRRAVVKLVASGVVIGGQVTPVCAVSPPPTWRLTAGPATTLHRVAVFGSDDRRDLPPAKQSLASKIGVLTDLGSRSQCTAFCVSETVIATAGHCLFRTRDDERPDLKNFRFRLHGSPASAAARIAGAHSAASVSHIVSGSMSLSVRPPIEATSDWALVQLDVPACTAGGIKISQQSASDLTALAPSQLMYQVGYHRDFPGERLAFGAPCLVSRSFERADWTTIQFDFFNANQLILHSCDTGGASSGSPLLIDGADGPEVVGINVGTYVQSRVLMVNGAVAHRYQAENVANTAVSARAFAAALASLERAEFLTARTGMRELQMLLSGIGVFSGPRDGLYGVSSRTAIETFERLEGLPITGLATIELLQKLRASNVAKAVPPAKPVPTAIETGSVRGLGLTSSAKRKPAR